LKSKLARELWYIDCYCYYIVSVLRIKFLRISNSYIDF